MNIDKRSFKNISIYYILYIAIKDHLNIHSVIPIYCIINDVDEHIEESNGNKYLIFASTDTNKEVLINYTKLNLIYTINGGKAVEYDEIK